MLELPVFEFPLFDFTVFELPLSEPSLLEFPMSKSCEFFISEFTSKADAMPGTIPSITSGIINIKIIEMRESTFIFIGLLPQPVNITSGTSIIN